MKDELMSDTAVSAYHSSFVAGAGCLYEQMSESVELDALIRRNLEVLGFGLDG